MSILELKHFAKYNFLFLLGKKKQKFNKQKQIDCLKTKIKEVKKFIFILDLIKVRLISTTDKDLILKTQNRDVQYVNEKSTIPLVIQRLFPQMNEDDYEKFKNNPTF